MWFSHRREFHVDAGGARLAGTGKMIAALERLKSASGKPQLPDQLAAFGINDGPGSGLKRLFMTHPPLDERIAAFKQAATTGRQASIDCNEKASIRWLCHHYLVT